MGLIPGAAKGIVEENTKSLQRQGLDEATAIKQAFKKSGSPMLAPLFKRKNMATLKKAKPKSPRAPITTRVVAQSLNDGDGDETTINQKG